MKLMSSLVAVLLCCTAWAQEPVKDVGITSLVMPEYPVVARQARIAGEVRLTITLEPSGKVVGVKSATGPDILVKSAKSNVIRWSYTPLAKSTDMEVVYSYRLDKPEVETNTPPVVELESPFHVVISANLLSVTGYDEGFKRPPKRTN